MSIFDRTYRLDSPRRAPTSPQGPPSPDQLALLYIILAIGSYYNLELPPDDSTVEEYLKLSQCCLSKADFMARNTMAGIQTLVRCPRAMQYKANVKHIMASLQL